MHAAARPHSEIIPLTTRVTLSTWWPLAVSWLCMGLELPAISAAMARLRDSTTSLAAYGGVVFPLALLIEAPVLMFLTASTARSRDWPSYRVGSRVMWVLSGSLTALHALVAFTPLYTWVARDLLGVPAGILDAGRLGLRIMTPWTLAIGYRRFQQGVLIRFGHSRAVGIGTAIRLAANVAVIAAGMALGDVPGIAVGTAAVVAGVVTEALYVGIRVRPVLRDQVRHAPLVAPALTTPAFLRFYAPLLVTPVLMMLTFPMASAAIARMPRALESFAVWPVVSGLVFTLRSTGFALNEVVVALLDRPRAAPVLTRFTWTLGLWLSGLLLAIAATPLGGLWFERFSALPPHLVALGTVGLWLSVALPGVSALQSLYQGAIVHGHETRGVTEAMLAYVAAMAALLGLGVAIGGVTGLHVSLLAQVLASAVQLAWLARRGAPVLRRLAARDDLHGAGGLAAV